MGILGDTQPLNLIGVRVDPQSPSVGVWVDPQPPAVGEQGGRWILLVLLLGHGIMEALTILILINLVNRIKVEHRILIKHNIYFL